MADYFVLIVLMITQNRATRRVLAAENETFFEEYSRISENSIP